MTERGTATPRTRLRPRRLFSTNPPATAAAAVPAAIAGPLAPPAARLSALGLAPSAPRAPFARADAAGFGRADAADFARVDARGFARVEPVDFACVDARGFARVEPVDFARVDVRGFALVVAPEPFDEVDFACLVRLPALLPVDFEVAMRATFLWEPPLWN